MFFRLQALPPHWHNGKVGYLCNGYGGVAPPRTVVPLLKKVQTWIVQDTE